MKTINLIFIKVKFVNKELLLPSKFVIPEEFDHILASDIKLWPPKFAITIKENNFLTN